MCMRPSRVPSILTPETIALLDAVAGEMYRDGTLFPHEEAKGRPRLAVCEPKRVRPAAPRPGQRIVHGRALAAIKREAVAKVERLIASGMPRLEAYEVVGVEVGRTARTVRDWLHTAGDDQ